MPANPTDTVTALRDACEREAAAVRMYRALAQHERNPERVKIFERLATIEEDHAQRFQAKLRDLNAELPQLDFAPGRKERTITSLRGAEATIRYMEAEEERNASAFSASAIDDPTVRDLFVEIEQEEQQHGQILQGLLPGPAAASRLDAMLKAEKWHRSTGSWLGDAIYGINDGLGAVFGIVLAVAGYAEQVNNPHTVLVAGLAGTLASALSMGSGAYLAAKSEKEVYETEVEREHREIMDDPEHEKEELELIYQLKGFSEADSKSFAATIAANPEQFLKTMTHEELGLSERSFPNPWISMLSATVSTGVGGFIPVAPFLFISGLNAVLVSAFVSTLAHFAVGASKTLVTGRSWVKSGLEMTVVGIIEAVLAYSIGLLLGTHVGG